MTLSLDYVRCATQHCKICVQFLFPCIQMCIYIEMPGCSEHYFCRFPTFSVGNLTRVSVRDALIRGITADQVPVLLPAY